MKPTVSQLPTDERSGYGGWMDEETATEEYWRRLAEYNMEQWIKAERTAQQAHRVAQGAHRIARSYIGFFIVAMLVAGFVTWRARLAEVTLRSQLAKCACQAEAQP